MVDMKKICVYLLALTLLILLFFTLFGETLYEQGKPVVTVMATARGSFSVSYYGPPEVLHTDERGDFLYIAYAIPPASRHMRKVYTVFRVSVLRKQYHEEEGMVFLVVDRLLGMDPFQEGTMLILNSTKPLTEGCEVLLGDVLSREETFSYFSLQHD
jgi:hypothetical protein